MQVRLYVEGGGESKEQHVRCREGFRKLLEKAGFSGRMPRIFAGGGRNETFDQFKTSILSGGADNIPILLVDSEDVVAKNTTAWLHLQKRDHWERPIQATDDQAQMMVTCMETWIMADRAALLSYFGAALQKNSLIPLDDLERRDRFVIQEALVNATRSCKRTYKKGKRSFEILAEVDPGTLSQYLPHFLAFIRTLQAVCQRDVL